MTATRLTTKRVEKPWGRTRLWPGFGDVPDGGKPVGEVWFEAPHGEQPALLIKYLFTSDKLSVQVHPNDEQAQARGYKRGKDEAWVILDAEPDATIALGTLQVMDKDELRASAIDGSIEQKLDWKPIRKDEFYYSPADTIHAIGPGLTLIEIQQNVDLTYRLYDYGSDRELHLDDGVAVADPVPYVTPFRPFELANGRKILSDGPKLVIERWTDPGHGRLASDGRPLWLIPIGGKAEVDGGPLEAGGVWLVENGGAALTLRDGADLVVAYPGQGVQEGLWARRQE